MSTGDETNAGDGPGEREECLADLLAVVHRTAARLLAEAGTPPAELRVRAGEVAVEMTWPDPERATAPGTDPSAAVGPAPGPVHAAPDGTGAEEEVEYIRAPTVGVFYRAPEPGGKSFVDEGDVVAPGRQLGIVEAMKLLIPVEAVTDGRIVEVLKADAAPVEYDEPLFAVRPPEAA
ncbi:biotin/lipoyl-containing protein [Streptomyces sp. JH34]|uniref:acetyl-CoA carboxylase biotin carboxyl carrier protein n=1 Tax=unclassified Streptomyces TaxID=2593676 RepID=UPI0023F6F577|nr:biotin/lipoyl-containing protein [Streptomyces sp. JH34]MDF6017390.1 acetyl-CoA carboxylase biotin carboxyl carrier protein subunit [Streptomyces sp. JH34]